LKQHGAHLWQRRHPRDAARRGAPLLRTVRRTRREGERRYEASVTDGSQRCGSSSAMRIAAW